MQKPPIYGVSAFFLKKIILLYPFYVIFLYLCIKIGESYIIR